MKRLFFVRHGLTEMNVNGIFSGQTETLLTEEGRQQAKQSGEHVKTQLPKIDLIICSPYKRTWETAKIIAKEVGYPAEKIQKNPLFIERSFGSLEGTLGKEFFKTKEYRDIDDIEDAETVEQLQERAQRALEYLETRKEDTILVVGHGAFGRALRRATKNLPHTHEYEQFEPIGNAEVLELI